MSVRLSSLRVGAEFDATKYVAGANQKVAADKAMAASSAQVGAAVKATDAKISTAGDVLSRLSRQYVSGFRESEMFHRGINALGRGIETGSIPMERAEAILVGMYTKYGLTANAAELMERGQVSLAQTVSAVNARMEMQEAAANGATAAMLRHGTATRAASFQQNNLRYQMFDVVQMLALGQAPMMTLMQQGPQIAQIYGPEEGGVARAFKEMGKMLVGAVTKFPLLTAGAIGAAVGLAGLVYEINKAESVTVGFGDVALAVFQSLRDIVAETLAPAFAAIAPYAQVAWDALVSGVKWVGNIVINSFRAAAADVGFAATSIAAMFQASYDTIVLVWGSLPATLGDLAYSAANAMITAIEGMINSAIGMMNNLINEAKSAALKLGTPLDIGFLSPVSFEGVGNPYAGAAEKLVSDQADIQKRVLDELKRLADERNSTIADIMGSDPMGNLYERIAEHSVVNALNDEKKKKGGAKEKRSEYESEIKKIQEETAALEQQNRVLELSTFEKERSAAVQKMLTAAQNEGLPIGKAFANAQELIKASSEGLSPALAAERDRILGVATAWAKASAAAEDAKKAQETMDFMKDLTKGFIDDLRSGLEQGKTFWEAFGNAAMNVLDKITDKLLNQVLDAIFKVNQAGSSSGGGGFFGILSKLFGGGGFTGFESSYAASVPGLYAHGAAFNRGNVIPFARGGVVDRPTLFPMANGAGLMGEAGPEAVMPLRRGADGRLGVAAANGNRGGSTTIVQVNEAPPGTRVREEKSKGPDGREMRRIVVDILNEEIGSGGTDKVMKRYGVSATKVPR